MKSFINFKIILLMVSSLLPWPESSHPSIGCSREFSFLVRNFVSKKWIPLFNKFKVDIPLSCPLHPERDIYHVIHQSKFQVDPRKWSCSLCGKSFHREPFLDLHMLKKHQDKLQLTEDSVCPADFCDLIRCEVLHLAEISKNQNQTSEFQNPREQQQTITALVKATPRAHALSRYNQQADICLTNDEQCKRKGWLILPSQLPQMHCCSPAPSSLAKPVSNQTVTQCRTNNTSDVNPETMLPSTSKEEELSERIRQKQSSCRDEDFIQLRSECARLIGMCTTGLILRLSNQQFLHLRDELNRTVCWHLQCDRYWTEVISAEASTSTLLLIGIAFAAVGSASSYIIVCVLCREPQPSTIQPSSCVDQVPNKERRSRFNGSDEWNTISHPHQANINRISKSSESYLKCLESSSFIIEADVEENSLI
ncbi:uncharacterized protein LOC124320770 [Daphnia pulicaria]|uniref:uncharacterized protein LOC124320770 n=1 Tax=Daphnia pulicaria TaxID=35523 RepID=UPI001EEBEA86|nr:uncharacterized protein LOC124320770 [Daphnia pulicaria]